MLTKKLHHLDIRTVLTHKLTFHSFCNFVVKECEHEKVFIQLYQQIQLFQEYLKQLKGLYEQVDGILNTDSS